jgi:hypothetical protein
MRFSWAPLLYFHPYWLELAARIRATVRNHLGNPAGIAPAKNRLQEELV